jgi:hypothetical protein
MSEVKEFVAIGEVKQPGADSVEADLRASSQEISANAWGSLFGCFFAGFVLHGFVTSESIVPTYPSKLPYERAGRSCHPRDSGVQSRHGGS